MVGVPLINRTFICVQVVTILSTLPCQRMAREGAQGVRVCLDIWHPDCWTLQMTAETSGGLLGHGVHEIDGLAKGFHRLRRQY